MIIADILLLVIVVVALLLASIFDIKSKEIPDWLNFSFILSALGVRLIYSLVYSTWGYFLSGLVAVIVMFLCGYLLFYTRLWGGGDAKILIALGAAFGTKPSYIISENFIFKNFNFLLVLLIFIAFVGAFYSLIWSIYIYFKNFKVINKKIKKYFFKYKNLVFLFWIFAFIFFVTYFIFIDFFKTLFLATVLIFLIYPLFFIVMKAIEEVGMFKKISVKDLSEGDWVMETIKINDKVVCTPKDLGITKKQLFKLRKYKEKVLIKDGIYFVPAITLGVYIAIIFGMFF